VNNPTSAAVITFVNLKIYKSITNIFKELRLQFDCYVDDLILQLE